MDGNAVYEEPFPTSGILIMGNEANGISDEVAALISKRISIPQPNTASGGVKRKSAESLNVATATAIFLNEIRRP